MAIRTRATATEYVLASTKKLVTIGGVALLLCGLALSAGVGSAAADDGGNDNTPVSSYPADPTWPAPADWGSYPAAATWPAPPNWGAYPASSTWPGTSSYPCCSR